MFIELPMLLNIGIQSAMKEFFKYVVNG